MDSPIVWWIVAMSLLAVPVAFALAARDRAWAWSLGGGAAWLAAIWLKQLVNPLLQDWLLPHVAATAAALGLCSALAELGLAAFVLLPARRARAAVAVGLGAGWFELVDTLRQALLALADAGATSTWAAVAELPAATGNGFVVERALTAAGHVSSRLLLFAALRARSAWNAVIAVVLFAVVDGVASAMVIDAAIANAAHDEGLPARFFVGLAAVTALEFALAVRLLRRLRAAASG